MARHLKTTQLLQIMDASIDAPNEEGLATNVCQACQADAQAALS